MKKISLLFFVLIPALLTGCSSVQVNSGYENGYDFTKLVTYKIIKPESTASDSVFYKEVYDAIDGVMVEKAYGKNNKYPDFLITWHYNMNKNMLNEITDNPGWKIKDKELPRQNQNILVIDIKDAESNKLIWRGWANNTDLSKKHNGKIIYNTVEKLLGIFPPENPVAFH